MRRPLGAHVPGRLRGRPAQPGGHDPLRGPQRAGGRARRAHLQRLAGPGGADARASRPAVHGRQPPAGEGLRRVRAELLHGAGLHQHARRAGPGRHSAGVQGPHRRGPDRPGRRPRRVQPGADRRLHRRGGHRRRRAGRPGHDPDHPRVEGRGPPRRPRGGPLPAGEDRRGLRPGVLRRRVPARRPYRPRRPEQVGRAVAGVQAHRHGPGRVAVPEAAAGPAGRDGPRADVRGDLPRLHPRLPLLPGGHDHPPGARTLHHRHRRHGRQGSEGHRLRGGRPALAVLRGPLGDRRHRQGPGGPLHGRQDRPVAAVHPRGRLQRRPGQRADPQRPPLRPDLRPRGRLRAHAQGHQQDGLGGRPHPHRGDGLRQRLAPGEAVLHVRPAHGDRRGRPADRRHGDARHPEGPRGLGLQRHPLHGLHRRLRAQAAHALPVGPAAVGGGDGRTPGEAARQDPRRQEVRPLHRLPLPRRQAGHRRGPAVPRRPPGGRRHPRRLRGRRPLRRLARALLLRPLDGLRRQGPRRPRRGRRLVHHPRAHLRGGPALGPPRLRPGQGLALGGLAGRPRRDRGRGLPLDPLLRLWRLPADGHGHTNRPDRQEAAALDGQERGPDAGFQRARALTRAE
ncbi:conserved hypothetical protein [Streptomyces misionensis JCM 4497]